MRFKEKNYFYTKKYIVPLGLFFLWAFFSGLNYFINHNISANFLPFINVIFCLINTTFFTLSILYILYDSKSKFEIDTIVSGYEKEKLKQEEYESNFLYKSELQYFKKIQLTKKEDEIYHVHILNSLDEITGIEKIFNYLSPFIVLYFSQFSFDQVPKYGNFLFISLSLKLLSIVY
jgi:hypothetical protein